LSWHHPSMKLRDILKDAQFFGASHIHIMKWKLAKELELPYSTHWLLVVLLNDACTLHDHPQMG